MNARDYGDVALSEAGARSMNRTRDAASVSVYEIRFTDPVDYIRELTADARQGVIEDGIVRLAIINAPASLEQIEGKPTAGGHRTSPWFRAKYVASSYLARGQLIKLSAYCGVSYIGQEEPKELQLQLMRECAQALQENLRKVQRPLEKLEGIDLRGGGLYVEDPTEPWLAPFLAAIEPLPQPVCKHCHALIYYANEAWRHKSNGRPEVTVGAVGRTGNRIQRLDHYAEPADEEAE